MILYILRHGQAGTHSPSDFERELTAEGIASSHVIGMFCKNMSIHFTHAFVSPLVRAKQTAREVLKSVPDVALFESEHLTPEADPRNLLEQLKSYPNNSRILMVTHEPFASTLISTVISGTESVRVMMKTTSFACIETQGMPARGNGTVLWLITSEMIKHLA